MELNKYMMHAFLNTDSLRKVIMHQNLLEQKVWILLSVVCFGGERRRRFPM